MMKKYFTFYLRLILSLQLVAGPLAYGDDRHTGDQAIPGPDSHLVTIPLALAQKLEQSPPLSLMLYNEKGNWYSAYYLGLYDKNTFQACGSLSDNCLPGWGQPSAADVPTSDEGGATYVVYAPGDPQYIPPTTDDVEMPDGRSPSQVAASNHTGWASTFGDIANDVASSSLMAGTGALVENAFGGHALAQAEAKMNASAQDLNNSSGDLNADIATGQQQAAQLVQQTTIASDNVNPDFTTQLEVKPNDDQIIDTKALEKQTAHFDPAYKAQVMKLSQQLNDTDDNHFVTYAGFKAIAGSAINSSVISRLCGWIDVSDAQLKMAEEALDVFYGLDPYTGLHRGLYEFYTGKNIITGRPLSKFQRGYAGALVVLHMTTLGIVPTVARAIQVVTMIALPGLSTVASTAAEGIQNLTKLLGVFGKAGVQEGEALTEAENLLTSEIKSGAISDAQSAETAVEDGIAKGEIHSNRFRPEFSAAPASDPSLKYIKSIVSPEGAIAKDIYQGNNGEIYVIGRSMTKIRSYKDTLVKTGYREDQIKIFEPTREVRESFQMAAETYPKKIIPADKLKNLDVWKENENHMIKAIGTPNSKPTIIDLGRDPDEGFSHFYDELEQSALKNSGRIKWNN